jgi:hypothetical protein
MTDVSLGNVCPRCGKDRVVSKVYREKVEGGYVNYKTTTCSDPACQKMVDKKLNDEAYKRGMILKEQMQREEERQKNSGRKKKVDLK